MLKPLTNKIVTVENAIIDTSKPIHHVDSYYVDDSDNLIAEYLDGQFVVFGKISKIEEK